MTEKTWTITYLDDTPSLKIEAESLVKAVEKVKYKLPYADLQGVSLNYADLSGADFKGADLNGASLIGADLEGTKGLPVTRLTLTQQRLEKRKEK